MGSITKGFNIDRARRAVDPALDSRRGGNQFLSDEELEAQTSRKEGAAKSREKRRQKREEKARTERSYLRAVIAEISTEDVKAVVRTVLEDAKNGDAAALAFLSKHILGNGKVGLDELSWAPMIRKSRR